MLIIVFLFVILAALFALEATTSVARSCGYLSGDPVAGYTLQSSLAVFSRVLVFMFMPALGLAADTGLLRGHSFVVATSFLLVPSALSLIRLGEKAIHWRYGAVVESLLRYGRFSPRAILCGVARDKYTARGSSNKLLGRRLKRFYLVMFFAYTPYYLSWPIVILIVGHFPDYRATIIGLSAVGSGFTTLVLAYYADPKLVRVGRMSGAAPYVFIKLLDVRLFSAILAAVCICALGVFLEL